jgi:hypothetical protein
MSQIFKPLYGSNNQALTITLASLAASATVGRESAAIDNSSALWMDVLLTILFETGTVSGNKQLLAFLAASTDGGATYTEGATGADAAFTRKDPTLLRPLAVIPAVTNSFIHRAGPFSVAAAFGGILPDHFNVAVFNDSGAALSGTAGNNKLIYQGVQFQGV